MKSIFLILFALPFTLFSQSQVELSPITIMKINEVVRDCLEDYEKVSKVKRGDEYYFYEIFSDNEILVDDIIPSSNYGNEINSNDWVKLMKGVNLYNIETEVLDWERYSPISLDSGVVFVRVKKTVLSSMWSDKVRKDFNIVVQDGDEERIQKVKYESEEEFIFKFIYSLNSEDILCRINSITRINELTSFKIFVPYKKALIGSKKLIDALSFEFDQANLFPDRDNISYFIEDENIVVDNLNDYKAIGYRKPVIKDSDRGFIKELVYSELIPITITYSTLISDKYKVVEFGDYIIPSKVEFLEIFNLSVSALLFSKNNLSLGLKGQKVMSTIKVDIDSNQDISQLDNPVSNYHNTYRRINTVTNFIETLRVDQHLLFATVNYKAKDFSFFAGVNILSINLATSQRSAHGLYSGIFEDFNIEISEPINYSVNGDENTLELGYKEWNLTEELEFTQPSFSVFEIGAAWTPPRFSWFSLNLVYKGNSESWFVNSSDNISDDINELSSFVRFSENITINGRLGLGVSLSYKF